MSNQIIRQSNGLYAVWSTCVDAIVMWNCTRQDMINEWTNQERERLTSSVNRKCDLLDQDRADEAYYQFAMSWELALRRHEELHGPLQSSTTSQDGDKN